MASQNDISARIATAKKEGFTDEQIYSSLASNAGFGKRISMAKKEGFSDVQIAQNLGLNLQKDLGQQKPIKVSASFKPFDWQAAQQKAMQGQAKAAGPTSFAEDVLFGFSKLGAGINQGFAYAGDKLGKGLNSLLGTNFDTGSYDRFTNQRKEVEEFRNLQNSQNGKSSAIGEFVGEVAGTAPFALLGRGYQGAKILSKVGGKVAAQNAGAGALAGAATFAPDAQTRKQNTLMGGVGGAVGGAVGEKIGQGVTKAVNVAKGRLRPEAAEVNNLGKQFNVRTTVGDISRGPISQKTEVALEQIPVVGTASFRQAQHDEAKAASNKLVNSLQEKFKSTEFKAIPELEAAASSGDRNANRILGIVSNAGDDSSKALQASAEIKAWRENKIAGKMYDEVGALARKQGGTVNPSNTTAVLKQKIDSELASLAPDDTLLKDLQSIQSRLNDANVVKDFSNMRLLRTQLGDLAEGYASGTNPNKTAAKFFGDLRSAVDEDIAQYANSSGSDELKRAYKRADMFYKNIMKNKDSSIAKAMKSSTPDEIYNQFIKIGKGDRAANFYRNLDKKGQAALRYEMANEALDKATNVSTGAFSPAKFALEFERLHEPYKNIFNGAERAEMDGFIKLMRHIERSGQFMENPPTGNRLAGFLIGGTAIANAPLAAKAAGLSATAKFLLTTEPGKRILLAAKDLPPNSPKLNNLLKMIEKLSVTTGTATTTQ